MGAEVTSWGCLSRGSRGRDCRAACVLYVYVKELCIIVGFGLQERCARDVMRPWGPRGAGKAVWVWAWGVWFVSSACYLLGFVFPGSWFGFHGEGCEDLMFRRCRGGVGQGCRVGGRDWAWWRGKAPEIIDFDVGVQR